MTDQTIKRTIPLVKETKNISLDDAILVKQCQDGDSAAMGRLIVKYQDRIYNVIYKICTNSDDAAELTQETFVKFIEKINTFRFASSFYTWLFRIAVNTTLNYCRRKVKLGSQSLDSAVRSDLEGGRSQLKAFLADKKSAPSLLYARLPAA